MHSVAFRHLAGRQLTAREVQILEHAAMGFSDMETARCLQVERSTVKKFKTFILAKLVAANTAHAVAIAYQRGYLHLEGVGEETQPQQGASNGTAQSCQGGHHAEGSSG